MNSTLKINPSANLNDVADMDEIVAKAKVYSKLVMDNL